MLYKRSLFFSRAIIHTILFSLIVLVMPQGSNAQMREMSEQELAGISAQAGISINIGNSGLRFTYESFRISDTDHDPVHWIEFNDITIDDGAGGYFSMDTPLDEENLIAHWNTIDVGTTGEGNTYLFYNQSYHAEPRTYTVGSFRFCDQELGSIRLGDMRMGASDQLIIGAHADGTMGIDLEYRFEIHASEFRYTYNTQPHGSLLLSGIHLFENAIGDYDDPADPGTWELFGKFRLGDIAGGKPVTMDVATVDTTEGPVTSLFLNVPMTGSIRVADVEFGGTVENGPTSFGPVAIDGITVHYLAVMLSPN